MDGIKQPSLDAFRATFARTVQSAPHRRVKIQAWKLLARILLESPAKLLPSAADLDAVAEEQRIKELTR